MRNNMLRSCIRSNPSFPIKVFTIMKKSRDDGIILHNSQIINILIQIRGRPSSYHKHLICPKK